MNETNGKANAALVDLFRHNTWANVKLLDACESLSEEQLDQALPGTFGTIRDTLLHIVGAEVSYVARVTGQRPGDPPKEGEFPGFNRLKHDARWTGEELLKLALSAEQGDLVRHSREGQRRQYPLSALMAQAITHSTEHRSQIATILTQQGIEPPDMSGWQYMDEFGYIQDAPADE